MVFWLLACQQKYLKAQSIVFTLASKSFIKLFHQRDCVYGRFCLCCIKPTVLKMQDWKPRRIVAYKVCLERKPAEAHFWTKAVAESTFTISVVNIEPNLWHSTKPPACVTMRGRTYPTTHLDMKKTTLSIYMTVIVDWLAFVFFFFFFPRNLHRKMTARIDASGNCMVF